MLVLSGQGHSARTGQTGHAGFRAEQVNAAFATLTGMKTRPACINGDGVTLFHSHERGAVIFDIERAFGIHFALAPRAFAAPA